MKTQKDKDIELWEAYNKNPSHMTLTPLMKQLDGIIQNEVNKWAGAIARPVLESKAKALTLEAIKSYNPHMGAALTTHVVNRLQKLSRDVYTHQDAVRIPEYKKLQYQSYMKGYNEIMAEQGREPTNQELANHMSWSPKKVKEVQALTNPEYVESMDVSAGMFDQSSVWGSDSNNGLVDFMYHDMDNIDKLIFEHTTGYSGKPILNNPQLQKAVGLTQGQLSYRKRKLIDQIQSITEE